MSIGPRNTSSFLSNLRVFPGNGESRGRKKRSSSPTSARGYEEKGVPSRPRDIIVSWTLPFIRPYSLSEPNRLPTASLASAATLICNTNMKTSAKNKGKKCPADFRIERCKSSVGFEMLGTFMLSI